MLKKLFLFVVPALFPVFSQAEVEVTVDLLIKADPKAKHELSRMVIFDAKEEKYVIEKTLVFSGKEADDVKTKILNSVDTESLTGWSGNQPEYYFNITDKESGEVLFKAFLSLRAQTWMVFDTKTGKPSIEAISDVKQLKLALDGWGIK